MAERRMAEIVGQRQRLGQVLVDAQRARQRARHLGDFERVGEPGAVVVALVLNTNTCVLCLRRRKAVEWMMRSRSRWKARAGRAVRLGVAAGRGSARIGTHKSARHVPSIAIDRPAAGNSTLEYRRT